MTNRAQQSRRTELLARRAALVGFFTLVAAVEFAQTLESTPLGAISGALVPACGWALVVWRFGRRQQLPAHLLLAAFCGGAVVSATYSSWTNDLLVATLGQGDRADTIGVLIPTLLAPIVEELAKAGVLIVVLHFASDHFGGAVEGLICGALVGLGFTFTENLSYLTLAVIQGGEPGLLRAVYIRAILSGCTHATFTATTGVALGFAGPFTWRPARWGIASLGLAGAILLHIGWNAITSRAITDRLCQAGAPGGPCRDAPDAATLYVYVPLIVVASLGPIIAGLLTLTRRARRHSDQIEAVAAAS